MGVYVKDAFALRHVVGAWNWMEVASCNVQLHILKIFGRREGGLIGKIIVAIEHEHGRLSYVLEGVHWLFLPSKLK